MDQRGEHDGKTAMTGARVRGAAAKPRRRPRVDQWTDAKRTRFLDHLAKTCNVKASVEVVGVTQTTAYKLRGRDPAFAEAWAGALEQGYQHVEAQLLACALGEDGEGAEARPFDFARGMQVMAMRKAATHPGRARSGAPMAHVSVEQAARSLCAMLDMLAKRLKIDL